MLPPGETFEFIVEGNKRDKIKRVIFRHGGEVVSETVSGGDIRFRVKKTEREGIV